MSSASFDPGIAAIQLNGAQANKDAVQSTIASSVGSGDAATAVFSGTLGDLKTKYPEIYQKVIIEGFANQIVRDAQRQNDRYIEELKKQRSS